MYVFTRNGATWAQQAYVKGANTEAFDEFGGSVALSRDGRTMVVTAMARTARRTAWAATRTTTPPRKQAPPTCSAIRDGWV